MSDTVEIDRTGDLTLILSKNLTCTPNSNAPTLTLLVSSKILTLASPVFAAMLSPRFREGQRNADSGSFAPIPLPDDDAAAMTVLCQIFHFAHAQLPSKPSLELLKHLAVLADKYDCVSALTFVSETWLAMWEATARSEDLEVLLFVSYVFGRAERFARISKRVVKEFRGNLKRLALLGEFDVVPEELLRGLQHQRKATLKRFEAKISRHLEFMHGLCDKSFVVLSGMRTCSVCFGFFQPTATLCHKCRTPTSPAICSRQSRQGEYITLLKDAGLDPVRLWSLMGAKSINEIGVSILKAQEASTGHVCSGSTTSCPLKEAFVLLNREASALVNGTRGLCFDCITVENEDVGHKSECVIGHGSDALVDAMESALPLQGTLEE